MPTEISVPSKKSGIDTQVLSEGTALLLVLPTKEFASMVAPQFAYHAPPFLAKRICFPVLLLDS